MSNNEANKKVTIWTRGFTMVLIANICTSLAQFGVNTYVSTYMGYLGTGAALTGVIAGLFYAVAFLLRPVSGPAITILNKKMLMILVYGLGIVVNLGYAFFPSVEIFVIMRILHGVQLAFYGSLALTVAADSLPESKMASGLGVYGLSYIAAQAFGPTLAVFSQGIGESFMGERGGFMGIFLMASLFSIMSIIPCFLLPNNEVSKEDKASLGAWYKNIIAKEAIIPSTVQMLMAVGMMLFNTYMIPYGEWRGINNISIYFTISALITLLVRPIAGKLTDQYGPAKIFYPSVALYACAFIMISFATDLKLIIAAAVCAAIGMSSAGPAVQVMVIQSVSPVRRGVASNTNFLGMDLGNFLGPTLAGIILSHYDYSVMFKLATIPIVLSMIVFALGWKGYLKQREILSSEAEKEIEAIME